jgi:small subunit ribosomal protein S17e
VGRIKTKLIKRVSLGLIRDHEKEFKKDFNANKEIIDKIVTVPSKKVRNVISGYVTRLVKETKE